MPTETELSELIAGLADEELLRRLHSGDLTDAAATVVRRELVARGVATPPSPAEPFSAASRPAPAAAAARRVLHFVWSRVVCFPLRAVQGVEPLWAVFVGGLVVLVGVFRLTSMAMYRLLATMPAAAHSLTVSYTLLAIYALTAVWLGVAMWRTARTSQSRAWRFAARAFGVLVALNCVWGATSAARLIHDHFKPPPSLDGPSIMDSAQ